MFKDRKTGTGQANKSVLKSERERIRIIRFTKLVVKVEILNVPRSRLFY